MVVPFAKIALRASVADAAVLDHKSICDPLTRPTIETILVAHPAVGPTEQGLRELATPTGTLTILVVLPVPRTLMVIVPRKITHRPITINVLGTGSTTSIVNV